MRNLDENLMLFGDAVTGDVSYVTKTSATQYSSILDVGARNKVSVNIWSGTVKSSGGSETYSFTLQSSLSGDFSGSIVDHSEYSLDKSYSNTQKDFISKVQYPYVRVKLEITNSGSWEGLSFLSL